MQVIQNLMHKLSQLSKKKKKKAQKSKRTEIELNTVFEMYHDLCAKNSLI